MAESAEGSAEARGWKLFRKAASDTTQDSDSVASDRVGPFTATPPAGAYVGGGGCPVVGVPRTGGGCPVVGSAPSNGQPASSNAPQAGQSKPLSTWRQASSIPTSDSEDAPLPGHQAVQDSPGASPYGIKSGVWTYPSEQMFFNAMKRKGWTPSEDDMTAVVAIHNAVNERTWHEIGAWEAAAGEPHPRLVRFRGRPADLSPKARLLNFLGYRLPFDRHDWVVQRGDGSEVRYVIDFYNGAPLPGMPMAVHLDVRPALDSPGALWQRLAMQAGWIASGRWKTE